MNREPRRALIVVSRPSTRFGSARRFVVSIDGQRAGTAKPGATAEFPVERGEHAVAVSMDCTRSRPVSVDVEPGARVELAIGATQALWLKTLPPICVALFTAQRFVEGRWAPQWLTDAPWGVQLFAVFLAALAAFYVYAVLARALVRDYWAVWTIDRLPRAEVSGRGDRCQMES